MYDSPSTLQECCVDFICENIGAVCVTLDEEPPPLLHSNLTERLLDSLGERKKLTNQVFQQFDKVIAHFKRLRITHAGRLTIDGLKQLRNYNLTDVEIAELSFSVSLTDFLKGCLNQWTLENLRSLHITKPPLSKDASVMQMVTCAEESTGRAAQYMAMATIPLAKMKCLRSINVSGTDFNQHCLDIITGELPLVESLDISSTKVTDLRPLLRLSKRLVRLNLYNLQHCSCEELATVLSQLKLLRQLDISDDDQNSAFQVFSPARFKIKRLITPVGCDVAIVFPNLEYLDISGKDDIDYESFNTFLSLHPKLQFIGLVNTNICTHPAFTELKHPSFRKDLIVAGNGTETQLVESLRRYIDRPHYVQKCLYHLFQLTHNYRRPREDIIKLIMPPMSRYSVFISIQMAATACLYNLSKGEFGQKIHPKWLKKIVHLTMNAMHNFPQHMQLQKNALLTLCNDRILQEVTFNKYRCAKLVMDCLCAFEDASMNRMCVAICSILAAKISTSETSLLGAQHNYMKKLLEIVRSKVNEGLVDITLKFTLSALWNLTDESPNTCAVFLEAKGLDLSMGLLQRFINDSNIETKVLGLLNNIAEVKSLRVEMMRDDFIADLLRLLCSTHLDVSYFAAGIIAHLASDGDEAWSVNYIDRVTVLNQLEDVVLNWKTPESEMVAYRSFNPLFSLLNCPDSSEIQLWAIWAMQHVCNRNYKRYCPMLLVEGGEKILRSLVAHPLTSPHVKVICGNILTILEEKGPFYVSDNTSSCDELSLQLME
ncbi:hypothetical protein CHUAL_006224 [Chamberlinius hualienensis]